MPEPPVRRPRWGVDFHVWDGIFQGSRSHLLGLYRAAVAQAPDIEFVLFLDGVDRLREQEPVFRAPNVTLVRMPARPSVVRLAWQLPRLQRAHQLDLMHMQYRLPLLPAGPCACTIHDVLFETHPQFFPRSFVWQSRLTSRVAVRRSQLLFAVSAFSRGELERLYGVPKGRIHVTYNGVDRQRFRPAGDGVDAAADAAVLARLGLDAGGYLLSVGRLEPRKNHAALVQAYATLGDDAPPLVILGQRDFAYGQVFDTIARLGLQQRVRVMEHVDDAALPVVMRHARLFVYPAFAEGFGMPVAEAMASGVPVITSDTTSLPEVAGPGALTVPPHDTAALARSMRDALADAAGCRERVRAGLAHVQRFDWDASARTMLAAGRAWLQAQPSRRA